MSKTFRVLVTEESIIEYMVYDCESAAEAEEAAHAGEIQPRILNCDPISTRVVEVDDVN